jgi:hypothetical protein
MLPVGVLLMLLGGGLMIKGYFTTEQEHEANILGAKISVTEKDRRKIPKAVSGTLLAVGAVLTVAAAVRGAKGKS